MPPEAKHQEDFRGPSADAFDCHELLHHFVIRMVLQALQIKPSVEHVAGQVLDERHFRAAEAAGAYLIIGQCHHTIRSRCAIRREELGKTAEDGRRRLGRQLLRRDRHAERLEGIAGCSAVKLAGADPFDDETEFRIGLHQVATGGGVVGLHGHRKYTRAAAGADRIDQPAADGADVIWLSKFGVKVGRL